MCGSGNTGASLGTGIAHVTGTHSAFESTKHAPIESMRAAREAKTPYPWVRDGSTTAPCVRPKHVLHVGLPSAPNMKVCVRHAAHARERIIPPKKNTRSSLSSLSSVLS